MNRSRICLLMAILAAPAMFSVAGRTILGEEKPADPSKRVIERPTKALLSAEPDKPVRFDVPKAVIELPAKRAIASSASPAVDNPKVTPGLVRWHSDFGAACEAARKSSKPVLLFQMLGKLDDQFC